MTWAWVEEHIGAIGVGDHHSHVVEGAESTARTLLPAL